MHEPLGRWISAALLLVLLAGCGSQVPATTGAGAAQVPATTAAGAPAAPTIQAFAQLPACANAGTTIPLPAKFPAAFPLPPGTVVISQEERSGERIIINTVAPSDVKSVAEFFERELPKAGFTPGEGESEPGEAESSFEGKGYRGRWKVNSVNGCPNVVTLTILAGP